VYAIKPRLLRFEGLTVDFCPSRGEPHVAHCPSVFRRFVCVLLTAFTLAALAANVSAQTASTDIVLWGSAVPPADVHGDWLRGPEPTASGGAFLVNPDRGRARISPALAAPADYIELRFNAKRATAYHLWVRMASQNNSVANDSVHVQFSDSVNVLNQPVMRIGTTGSAEVLLQDGELGAVPQDWGWADNAWGTLGAPVYFAADGTHVLRIQRREDGAIIDSVVLSPATYATKAPGSTRNDGTVLPSSGAAASIGSSIVLRPAKAAAGRVFGSWQARTDATAAGGQALRNPDVGAAKIAPALANPASYFEATFTANAGTAYHVWVRVKADANSGANDSVHVQFSDSVTSSGSANARIGTTSSHEVVLQESATAAAPRGWGWADNGWGSLGTNVFFAKAGTHTIRVQQREDGAAIDQIVISPDTFLSKPPGWRLDDAVILPESAAAPAAPPSNLAPTVALTAPLAGATFMAPAAITLTANASDPENALAKVDFYNGSTLLGSDTTAPYSFSWSAVTTGTYQLKAVATDAAGATATSAIVAVTVGSATTSTLKIAFTASTNHATVTRYMLEVFPATANTTTAVPTTTSDLGKPTPSANGDIVVDRTTFLNALARGSYLVTISAVNAAGSSRSMAIPFSR
jgi:hypothetical protein